MNTIQIAKRVTQLIKAEVKDIVDMGLKTGCADVDINDLTTRNMECLNNGIFLNVACSIASLSLGVYLNGKIYSHYADKAPRTMNILFGKKLTQIGTAVSLAQIGMSTYDAFKARYNSPEFKKRRAARALMGANYTLISVVN